MNGSSETPDAEFSVEAAARILEAGGLVAFPTETVYGLGADAENPTAVSAIYAAKGRPTIHLATGADPEYWSNRVDVSAQKLIAAFWPGPLTLILPRHPNIPDAVAGGQATIGLRCPSHPVAQALLQAFRSGKGGIAAPSANRFGHVSPTTASHVREEFLNMPLVRCVLEGGQSSIGIESTILDLTSDRPALRRPGGISVVQIAEVLGALPVMSGGEAPPVSGSLASHYAPGTPVAVVPTDRLPEILAGLSSVGRRVVLMRYTASERMESSATVRQMPQNAGDYAHDFYAVLRQLDHAEADIIIVEALPATAAWGPVVDRLTKAAHGSTGVLERLLHPH